MKSVEPRYGLHDALTLALANAEDEADGVVARKDKFLSFLLEYGWNVTPLEMTLPDHWKRTNVQRIRNECPDCGASFCEHVAGALATAHPLDGGWRSDE